MDQHPVQQHRVPQPLAKLPWRLLFLILVIAALGVLSGTILAVILSFHILALVWGLLVVAAPEGQPGDQPSGAVG